MSARRRFAWLAGMLVLLVLALTVVRFVFLSRDVRRELDDVVGPLQVSQNEIDTWRDDLKMRARTAALLVSARMTAGASGASTVSASTLGEVAAAIARDDSVALLLVDPKGTIVQSYGLRDANIPGPVAGSLGEVLTVPCTDDYCAAVRVPVTRGAQVVAALVLRVGVDASRFHRLNASSTGHNRTAILVHVGDSVRVI